MCYLELNIKFHFEGMGTLVSNRILFKVKNTSSRIGLKAHQNGQETQTKAKILATKIQQSSKFYFAKIILTKNKDQ